MGDYHHNDRNQTDDHHHQNNVLMTARLQRGSSQSTERQSQHYNRAPAKFGLLMTMRRSVSDNPS